MSTGRRPYTRSVARAAASSSATETQTFANTQPNSTDAARSRRERKPKKFINQSEATTQIQEATTFTNQILPEEAAGSSSAPTKQTPVISRPKRGRPKKDSPVIGTEIEKPEQKEQVVLSNENEQVTRAESSQQIFTTQQIPIVPRPKRGRKPKNTLPVETRTETRTIISEQNEQMALPNEQFVEVDAIMRADPGSASTQQMTIISRLKRRRKPKKIETEIENPKQNEQVVLPSEQPVEVNATRAESLRRVADPCPDPGSTSTQQEPSVPRPKRGRKPKNTLPVETGAGTEVEAHTQSEQPAEVAMRAEGSRQLVTDPRRGRKPGNTSVQNAGKPVNVPIENNDFNEYIISKRGYKRKAVTEDSVAADRITSNSNVDGGSPNPYKRGRKNLPEQKSEVQVESIEASGTSAEITTFNNRELMRKEVTEDNNEEAVEQKDGPAKPNKKPKTKPKKPKKPEKPKEKRRSRIKRICPASIRERIYRAESQRIYMVSRTVVNESKQEFVILGSTGNVYTVTISHTPNCTCPDFLKGFLCKHIIFVYLRVLRLDRDSMYIYQKALLTDELKEIFASAAPDPTIMANERVRNRYKEFTSGNTSRSDEKRRPIEGDCPVCYEPLEEKDRDDIVWCKDGCGNNLHKDCFVQWKKTKQGDKVTCVYCRVEWIESNYGDAVLSGEGYVNLGNVQGMSRKRDTSTYYRPNRYTQGSWY